MRIVIDINVLTRNPVDAYAGFVYQLLLGLVKQYEEHEFIFICHQPAIAEFIFDKKVTTIVAGPKINNRLQHKYWYAVKIPLLLKNQKADFFISPEGNCSFNTKVPQCIMLPDLSFIHSPLVYKKASLFFFNRAMKKKSKKAAKLITLSNFSKKVILANYSIPQEKIFSIKGATNHLFRALSEEQKEDVKAAYSQNKNYFIGMGNNIHFTNTTNLLKAFSAFKKRQKSDWKLILTSTYFDNKIAESLRTYKYRNEVITVSVKDEHQRALLIGSAYGLINPSLREDHGILLHQALRCATPVVAAPGSAWEEIAGDAILYANVANYHDLADKMMLLYKDEVLRRNLIVKGTENIAINNSGDPAKQLWKCIMDAMK